MLEGGELDESVTFTDAVNAVFSEFVTACVACVAWRCLAERRCDVTHWVVGTASSGFKSTTVGTSRFRETQLPTTMSNASATPMSQPSGRSQQRPVTRTLFVYGANVDNTHQNGTPVPGDSALASAVSLLRRCSRNQICEFLKLVARDVATADAHLRELLQAGEKRPPFDGVDGLQHLSESCVAGRTSLIIIPGCEMLVATGTPGVIEGAKPLFEGNNKVGDVVMACAQVELCRRFCTKKGYRVKGVTRPLLVATVPRLDLAKLAQAFSHDDPLPWSIAAQPTLVRLWRVQGKASATGMPRACSQMWDGITKLAAARHMPTCSYLRVVRDDHLLHLDLIKPLVGGDGDTLAVVWATKYLRTQLRHILLHQGWRDCNGGLAPPRSETWVVAIAWQKELMRMLADLVPTNLASRCSATLANAGTARIPSPADAKWLSDPGAKSALCAVSKRIGISADGVAFSASGGDTIGKAFLSQVVEPAARKWLKSHKATDLVDKASVIQRRWENCLGTAQTVEHVVDLCDDVIRGRTPPHTHMSSVSCCSSRCLFLTLRSC